MPISWRRENDGFIMTHKLKTETFSQKIENSGGVIFLPLAPLFSFVTFHLKSMYFQNVCKIYCRKDIQGNITKLTGMKANKIYQYTITY